MDHYLRIVQNQDEIRARLMASGETEKSVNEMFAVFNRIDLLAADIAAEIENTRLANLPKSSIVG